MLDQLAWPERSEGNLSLSVFDVNRALGIDDWGQGLFIQTNHTSLKVCPFM